MRRFLRLFGLIVGSAILCAADPFVGYWKLNSEKSVFLSGLKAVTGGITYEMSGQEYVFHEAVVFADDKVARRWGPVQFGRTKRLNDRAVAFASKVDANTYEVIYADTQTGQAFCIFRYSVFPQIKTLIVTVFKSGDETPVETRVYERQ
jgi:hypothetical protein